MWTVLEADLHLAFVAQDVNQLDLEHVTLNTGETVLTGAVKEPFDVAIDRMLILTSKRRA